MACENHMVKSSGCLSTYHHWHPVSPALCGTQGYGSLHAAGWCHRWVNLDICSIILVHLIMKSLAVRVCADFVMWFRVQHQGPLTITVVLSDSSNHPMYCNVVRILAAHPADCTGLHKSLPVCLPSQTCNSAICIVTAALQTGFSCTCLKKECIKSPASSIHSCKMSV